jgi:hypothetical protein
MSLAEELDGRRGDNPRLDDFSRGIDHMVDLLLRPESFFKREISYYPEPAQLMGVQVGGRADTRLLFVAWICGMGNVLSRLDTRLLREQFGSVTSAGTSAAQSWPSLWGMVLVSGIFGGLFTWYFWGWWFRVRARWSGAVDPDPFAARLVCVWSNWVWAFPAVIWALIEFLRYPDYRTAFQSDGPIPWFISFSVFWSVFVSYRGAHTAFEMDADRARWWFLILPSIIYLAIFIVIVGLSLF